MSGPTLYELPQPVEVPVAGTDAAVHITHVGRGANGLHIGRVHILNGKDLAVAVLSLDDDLARRRLVRQALESDPSLHEHAGAVGQTLVAAAAGLRRAVSAQALTIPVAPDAADAAEGHRSQATQLVDLAIKSDAEFFHTPEGEPYVTFDAGGRRETWLLKAKGFRRWLQRCFFEQTERAAGSQAVQDALGVLEGKALFEGPELRVWTRLAEHNGSIYIDLGNEAWEAVAISANGWQVVADPPVRFRRSRGTLPLPRPVAGGSLDALRPFVNAASDEAWRLLVAWLLAALRATGPYPVLIVLGEQGSAKSTLLRLLWALVDPNTVPLRTTPHDERDLMIAAANGWTFTLDNLSGMPAWLSDALCRLATGGGLTKRELYSDADEVLFDAQRPSMLNGIEEVATRPDLLDRALSLVQPRIPDEQRRPEREMWAAFAEAQPRILGALYDAVAAGLANLPSTNLPRLPRMADFALWVTACESALGWDRGTFMAAYDVNRSEAHELALDESPLVPHLRTLLATCGGTWEGTASTLLDALTALLPENARRPEGWPKKPNVLSGALRRLAPNLRATGIDVRLDQRAADTKRTKRIDITTTKATPPPVGTTDGQTGQSVQTVQTPPTPGEHHRVGVDDAPAADRPLDDGGGQIVQRRPSGTDDADDADDPAADQSAQAGAADEERF